MKIRLRLLLLLGCLLAVFAVAAAVLHESHRREAATISADIARQRTNLLDRLLVLTGQSLESFASDYALWDDMAWFVESGDREWAKFNLADSLSDFDAQAAWVFRPDGSLAYRAGEPAVAGAPELPFAQAGFIESLRRKRELHFFVDSSAGFLEIRVSPIYKVDDGDQTPPRGWLVAARIWDDAHLKVLSDTLQSEVSFNRSEAGGPARINLERVLSDWTGQPLRTLHVSYESLAMARLLEGNEDEILVLLFLGVGMMFVTTVGLSRWIVRPLNQLGRSLETGGSESLASLRSQPSEFGHLARLVEQSFSHRRALENEVRERSRLAESLQETGAQLRESIELRNRLARDLHDGVIQSIYAAGLGLEGVRSTLETDPAGAAQRLASCQAVLNDTIRNVRAYINGLEADSGAHRPFQHTVATLLATIQAVQPGNIVTSIDENVARRISPAQELQILHLLRESISNALRHADPSAIRVTLEAAPDQAARLTVADDGCGFDPARPGGSGRGLVNLGIRAREMGGTLEIDSSPGKGTRIILRFNPTYPP